MIEYIVNKEKRTIVAMIKFGNHEETFKDSYYIYDDISWALTRIEKMSLIMKIRNLNIIIRKCFSRKQCQQKLNVILKMNGMKNMANNLHDNVW